MTDSQKFRSVSSAIILDELGKVEEDIMLYPELVHQTDFGDSLLHIAADNVQYNICRLLLESGADPNLQDALGETALHLAVFRRSERIVNLLLNYKADPNLQTFSKKTALHYATEYQEPRIINSLIFHGASLDIQDKSGNSPREICEMLSTIFKAKHHMETIVEVTPTEELDSTINSARYFKRSAIDKYRLHTRRKASESQLFEFFCSISLKSLYEKFIDFGLDDLQALAFQMKTPLPISHKILKEVGIEKPGDRSKLIVHFENISLKVEDIQLSFRVEEILECIGLAELKRNFIKRGMRDLTDFIENSSKCQERIDQLLKTNLEIQKPGHRLRILGALQFLEQKSKSNCNIL